MHPELLDISFSTHDFAAHAWGDVVDVHARQCRVGELHLHRITDVHLESDQPEVPITECLSYRDQNGDFTGTHVVSTKPVAVFSGNERGNGNGGANPEPPDPPNWNMGTCCTEPSANAALAPPVWKEYSP